MGNTANIVSSASETIKQELGASQEHIVAAWKTMRNASSEVV